MSLEIKVGAALYEVIDPELGINIMDLGLIYEIDVDDHHHAMITMTLTTPGCPLHDSIMNGVKHRVSQIEGIEGVSVNLVWEPAWTPHKMSDKAKHRLGFG